jgi:hypothetical protein
MHPKPIGRIAPNRLFKSTVDINHDGGGGPRLAVFKSWNFRACLDTPAGQAYAVANARVQAATVSQSEDCRGGRRRTVMSQERQAQTAFAGILVGEEAQDNARLVHEGS